MLRLLTVSFLYFVGNSFVINNFKSIRRYKIKNSYDEMPSTNNDYYIDPYIELKKKSR